MHEVDAVVLVGNAGRALAKVSLRWGGSFISLLNVLWEAHHEIAHRTTMFDRYVIRFLSYPFRLKGTNGASIPTAYSSVRHSEDMGLGHLRVPLEPPPDISTSTTLDEWPSSDTTSVSKGRESAFLVRLRRMSRG